MVAAVIMVLILPLCEAFLRASYSRARAGLYPGVYQLRSATASAPLDPTNKEKQNTFHPLGPPTFLSNLAIGDTFLFPSGNSNITRLSSLPDIFLIRNILSTDDQETLMEAARVRGMNAAGTRKSELNSIRKNSHLMWIDPYNINSDGSCYYQEAASIAREMILKARLRFSHEVMNNIMDRAEVEYSSAEDMQIAKYDRGGRFDYHHDGFGRYLTVLTYLNGIGGTYFPFGNMGSDLDEMHYFPNENNVLAMDFKEQMAGEKCGMLIVGREGSDTYLNETASVNPKTIIEIQAGDAIAFYNYDPEGSKDLRSFHASLTVPEEKWIATCWFRSDALTGPFSSFKKARLLEDWTNEGISRIDQ